MSRLNFEPFYQDYLDLLNAYRQADATIYIDQNTCAPKAGARDANQVLAILGKERFKIENNPETIEKIRQYAKRLPEDSLEKKELDLRLEMIDDNENIPADEYAAFIAAKGESETTWHEAKAASDYEHFKPKLKDLMEKQLKIITYSPRYKEGYAYDFMLDRYEKGMNQEKYDAFFETIKEELPPLIEKIRNAKQIDDSLLTKEYDEKKQDQLSKELLQLLNADFDRLYLSTTEHPFTDFVSFNDARITTHYYPDRLASAVLSTIHEYGHAQYQLQMDPDFDKTLLNEVGMAAHESQSRFMENHIGRSLSFWKKAYPLIQEKFEAFENVPVEQFVEMLNVSKPGLVRTEADELTYPLHILIRYEIEKKIADGTLDYDKLPEIWADLYEKYLGVRPENDKDGVLQDMHWSAGDFGYFPTYALGSAYAAQIDQAMREQLDVDCLLENGQFEVIQKWLKENIHSKSGLKTMEQIVEEVSGKPFDPHIYTDYLKEKYSKLYQLD